LDSGVGLDELRRLMTDSNRGDWNVISCFGMPSFLPWSPEGDFNEHHTRAAYRPNVSIGLAWGITDNENYQADWVQEFEKPLNRPAPSFIADIFYNGMLVARELLVLVDAGRCYLPIPRKGMQVNHWDHDFAKLLDDLQLAHGVGGGLGDPSRSEFKDYFRRAGLSIAG
jgi:hypothetical protein